MLRVSAKEEVKVVACKQVNAVHAKMEEWRVVLVV